MHITTLGLHDRVPGTLRPGKPVPFVLGSTTVHRGHLPGRGLIYSVLVHEIVFFGLLFLSVPNLFDRSRPPFRPPERFLMVNLREPTLYLPILGEGKPSEGREGAGLEARRKAPSVASAPSSKGLSYPGPQPILSDFPEPTNRFQTILQPELKNPAILPPPLSLPNLVRLPEFEPPAPPVEVKQPEPPPVLQPQVKPIEPPSELASALPIDAPKLVVPAIVSRNTPMLEIRPPEPPPKIEPPEPVPPTPAPPNRSLPKDNGPQEPAPKPVEPPLLTLSPTPAPPREEPIEIPRGEARGRFAISPEGNLSASDREAGSKPETPISTAGIGSRSASSSGKTDDGNTAPLGSATTGGSGSGGKDKDSLSVGKGTGRGSGVGSAPGTGAGSTSGTSSGPGKNPFPGITILGGGAPDTRKSAPVPVPPQASWGVMILSRESSGGGLPNFGVFPDQQIYTVYLDMRKTTIDPAASWIFEYGTLQETAQASGAKSPSKSQQGLVLPFPAVKEQPVLPAELVRKYLRRMVIVYSIVNADGKMEQMSVKESPDPLLNEPILTALSKWVFRPGHLGGETVPMKLLLGIPLALPQ
jgi:hypothetical protein